MPRTNCLLPLCLLFATGACAQFFHVTGKITTNQLEPLAYASIQVKETKTGVLSRSDGSYDLKLEEGKYDLVVTMVGYQTRVMTVIVNRNTTVNFLLDPGDSKNMSEVVVKARLKDRAEEFVRNVIRRKAAILAAPGPFSCEVYIRALQIDSMPPKKKKQAQKPDTSMNLQREKANQYSQMAMAEISLRYDQSLNKQMHEERTGVSKRGNPEQLFYLSVTEGDFNLYNNQVAAPGLLTIPMISPISYSGLLAYRYKTQETITHNGHKIYTISFRPRQMSNATMEGELVISDSGWVILSASFSMPRYHLPSYDRFEVDQTYEPLNDSAWMITRQQFTYQSRYGKGKRSGETVARYHHYELNKTFPKGYFGNEISATAAEAYKRDTAFWRQARTEPLSTEQIAFMRYNDSVYIATHTKAYLDSMDRVINKVTWKKLLILGQPMVSHEKERNWSFPSLLSLYQPLQIGGTRLMPMLSYGRTFPNKKTLMVFGNLSYGFRNKDLNGSLSIARMYNPFNRAFFRVAGGRDFGAVYAGDAWINQLKRSNYFLDHKIGIGHGQELANGLFLYTDIDFSYRRSLAGYKTGSLVDSIFTDVLNEPNSQPIDFESYNAVYGKIKLAYTPGQRYIREPHQKVILGSKWPTVYALWRKGIPGVLKSKVNFDYLEFGLEQQFPISTAGTSSYTLLTGSFINQKDLRLVDYKFQRRGDPLFFMNPNEAFQSLDSTFPVFKRFYQAHYIHDFNGFLLNKIPLLKKLELREVAGGGFLFAPERNNLTYAELFTGIERVFKWPFAPGAKFKLGAYIVGSAANNFRNPIMFKIGITSWDRVTARWR